MKTENDCFERVYALVCKVPRGMVTTYGDVAEQLGIRSSARMVGWALNGAELERIPAHRVVNRYGALTGKMHFLTPGTMHAMLEAEGITFLEDGRVDLTQHRYQFSSSDRV